LTGKPPALHVGRPNGSVNGIYDSKGDTTMLTKTKIALATALILGTASAALASNENDEQGGYQVQTWQQIQQDQRAFQNQIQGQYHTGNAGSAYGYVVSPKHTHRASHERTQDR
jgi:hypothetical protein